MRVVMKVLLCVTFFVLTLVPSVASAQSWTPPVGIPAPSFGITQQPPSRPSSWPSAAASGFYYVDRTHSAATDSSNQFGYPNRPRASIPEDLPAGAYVEVRGTGYTNSSTTSYTFNGTASNPVFLVGVGSERPLISGNQTQINLRGNYFIIDGLHFRNLRIRFGESNRSNVTHGTIRNSEIEGWTGSGTSIVGFNGGVGTGSEQIVIYKNYIHDNGPLSSSEEVDVHGVHISSNTLAHHVWYVDNRSTRNSGDSIQVGTATPDNPGTVAHHIYIGRNDMSDDRENAVDIKASHDVIVSENTAYNYTPTDSSGGVAMVAHDDPTNVWFINNRIHTAIRGIVSTGANRVYVVGNVLYNIKSGSSSTSSLSDAAIRYYGTTNFAAVGNTIWNADVGISNSSGSDPSVVVNNLIGGTSSFQIAFSTTGGASASTVSNNLVVEPIRMRMGESRSDLSGCVNCRSAASAGAVQLANPGAGDFRIASSTSPVVDRGVAHAVYSTFESLYGISIRRDIAGNARTSNSTPDIGAYEWNGGGSTPPPPQPGAPAAPSGLRIIR
jgi:hypothetical protein